VRHLFDDINGLYGIHDIHDIHGIHGLYGIHGSHGSHDIHGTSMAIDGMNHFTVLTDDIDVTRKFYVGILGLKEGYRPPLGFPGTWLYAANQPVLHVVAGRPLPEDPAGVLDHMAFSASNLPDIAAKLRANGIKYDLRKQPDSGVWQLFCFDPSGARVELDFAPGEKAPA
jgi:catechol 2,3-dioxygenase-like lactoylglutathione lyase family enzyme